MDVLVSARNKNDQKHESKRYASKAVNSNGYVWAEMQIKEFFLKKLLLHAGLRRLKWVPRQILLD